ncbi:hypothetical protein BDV38DRAFT_254046 [Aspergillus pseudotamarii]|uniref:Uncharacterized protein n=1 Tax=Aspergillus pseudotamarii TaxID=132259 RepID=A0A5N6SJA0_ASPPS|nr:uncharacterized protein BDV38DRAFT_254046 [Aspergillus pseudotamarii]KAE8134715.1 hypothetical protein BDV38DRAFT_254046 [Aspergillus pseudotamarii]
MKFSTYFVGLEEAVCVFGSRSSFLMSIFFFFYLSYFPPYFPSFLIFFPSLRFQYAVRACAY